MSVTALAASVVAVLTPYIVKGAESVAGELGKKALGKGEALLSSLWARWKGKPDAETILSKFVDDPEVGKANFQTELALDLATDEAFREAVQSVVNGSSPQAFQQQIVRNAAVVTGPEILRLVKGAATQIQDVQSAALVEGPKIGTIGE